MKGWKAEEWAIGVAQASTCGRGVGEMGWHRVVEGLGEEKYREVEVGE